MTGLQFWDWIFTRDHPVLPEPWLMQVYLHGAWAVVLSCAVFFGLRVAPWARSRTRVRGILAGGMAVWALLPGAASSAYWLGLAFGAPSVLSVLLCVWWMTRDPDNSAAGGAHNACLAAAIALGYVLLLDTLALLPLQCYAFGFSPLALALLLAVALAAALMPHTEPSYSLAWKKSWLGLPALALCIFAVTRLPTGNVWDVVLDPILWLVLQGAGVMKLRAAIAIRA